MSNYIYFVSYSFSALGYHGFGNCEHNSAYKITTIDQVYKIRELIKKSNPEYTEVVILNYQLLRIV